MTSDKETIGKLEEEIRRLRRELASYKVAAGRVGDHLTEIAELNQKLADSRREINLILETTSDAMRMIDRECNIIWANKAMEEFCGLSGTRIKEKKCHQIISTRYCRTDGCLLRRTLKEKKRITVEEEVVISGEKRICIITASPCWNERGEVTGTLEDFVDITERKRAESELRDSEEKYRRIFETANDLIVLIDRKGKIIDANRRLVELSGYGRDDIVGKNIRKLAGIFTPKSLALMVKNFMKRLAGMEVPPYEVEFVRPDGSHGWAEIGAVVFKDEGKPVGTLAILRDITTRRRMERELENKSRLLTSTLNSTADGILVADKDSRILLYNDRFIEIWRIPEKVVKTGEDRKLFAAADKQLKNPDKFLKKVEELYGSDKVAFDIIEFKDGRILERYSEPLLEGKKIVGRVWSFRDITHRRRIEKELESQQRLLLSTLNSTADGILVVDSEGKVSLYNDRFVEMWQVPERLLDGKDDRKLLDYAIDQLADPDRFLKKVDELYGTDRVDFEQIEFKDGRCFERYSEPLLAGEVIVGRVWSFRDITERRKAMEAARESEHFLKGVFNSIQDGLSVLNTDLTIRHTNEMMKKWYSEKLPLEGKECFRVYQGRSEPCQPCPTLRCLRTGTTEREVVAGPPGSEVEWIELFSFPMKDGDTGRITGVVEFVRDITDRRRAEESSRESEEKSRTVIENSDAYIYMVSQDYRIELVNTNLQKRFAPDAASPRELEGKLCYRVIAGLNGPCPDCRNREVFEGKRLHYEKILADGSIMDVYNAPIHHADGRVSKVSIFSDITEKRRMEDELLKTRKLQSVGILAGGIAHDFNNILTAILGNVSLVKLDIEPNTDVYRSIEKAEAACMRARGLTQQLLTFSSGGSPVKKAVSLEEIIRESTGFALHGSNVKCDLNIPDDLRAAEADPDQIGQVINNLVINADQAMPEGGEMRIRAENIILEKEDRSLPPGRYLKLKVEDSGIGIPEKHLKKIFDPYFTTKQKGSGLGLATVYSIIEKHAGKISVSSREGEGTVFTILLPASDEKVVADREKEDEPLSGTGRILVMDDEDDVRETACRLLERQGYRAEGAAEGGETLEKYRGARSAGDPFRAVILDLTIKGGMGGVETLEKLREIDPDVKAIVSSGYSTDAVMARYREKGFAGMVAKPYKNAELSRVLYRVINPGE